METIKILRPIEIAGCNIRTQTGRKANKRRTLPQGEYPIIQYFSSSGGATHGNECVEIQKGKDSYSLEISYNKPISQSEIDRILNDARESEEIFKDNPSILENVKQQISFWSKVYATI